MSLFTPISYPSNSERLTSQDLDGFLIWAVKNNVSDITIQNEDFLFCEIYGKKHKVLNKKLTKSDLIGIISKLHSDGAISILNSGQQIDYAYFVKENRDTTYRFRVNLKSISVLGDKGFSLAIRVINNQPPLLENLSLSDDLLNAFKSKRGSIYVSGPTGSGKSTLLASILAWRLSALDAHLKVSTLEQPIEFTYDYLDLPTATISQMEIGINIPSFADGVRNSLRTRSDIVLVGESRDYETISASIYAAMTGPLVFSTTHTGNVSEVVSRLISVFPEGEKNSAFIDLVSNLKVLINQILVPSLDGKRIPIREYLIFTPEIIETILYSDPTKITHTMRKIMKQFGFNLIDDLTLKHNLGLISTETYEHYL